MESLFQAIMYFIFGKRWILLGMRHGYKTAIFVNEIEIDMQKGKIARAVENKANAEKELAELEATPMKEAMLELPEELRTDSKALFEMENNIKEERAEAVKGLKNRIHSLHQEEQLADGELNRTYSIAYGNRIKYDFIKDYKIKDTYADLSSIK